MSTEALAAQSTKSSVNIVAWWRHDVDTALLAHCEEKSSVEKSGHCYPGSLLHQNLH